MKHGTNSYGYGVFQQILVFLVLLWGACFCDQSNAAPTDGDIVTMQLTTSAKSHTLYTKGACVCVLLFFTFVIQLRTVTNYHFRRIYV